jgi:hypothetical protein
VSDGVEGVGFVQGSGVLAMACIAWPDAEPKKYVLQDIAGVGVERLGENGEPVKPDGEPLEPEAAAEVEQSEPESLANAN